MPASALPDTMRQIRFDGAGGPEVIAIEEVALPKPGPGQVLIEVVAAGVNRPDIMQRLGSYPPPKGATDIPGLEVGGRIAALGEGVEGFSVGDEVCALVISGGYAEVSNNQCVIIAEELLEPRQIDRSAATEEVLATY